MVSLPFSFSIQDVGCHSNEKGSSHIMMHSHSKITQAEAGPMVREQTIEDWRMCALSLRVAVVVEAQPNGCYLNAWLAVLSLPDLFSKGHLIEGWMVLETESTVEVIEHGWCELADGRIIDPSLPFLIPTGEHISYFAGVRHRQEEVRALEGQMFPQARFDGQYGEDGLGHPQYRAAYQAAVEKAQWLASHRQPEKEVVIEPAQLPEDEKDSTGPTLHVLVVRTSPHKNETATSGDDQSTS
jgi:hypothetical protein